MWKIAGRLAFLSLILLGAFGTMLWLFGQVVSPGYMGVRQTTFGPFKGFSDQGLEPGLHWTIPFYSKVHLVPEKLQMYHLHRDHSLYPNSPGSLEVQTTDGSSVNVDISILARFFVDTIAGEHGGPADLIKKLGISEESWRNTVIEVARDELRRTLGGLSTGQFYNPHLREEQVERAKQNMVLRLGEYGIGVDAVLLRRYTYTEERIDNAVFQKNLQDQEERLNAAASKLAEAKARSEQVAAEMDAKIRTLLIEGENKAKVIKSEGSLFEKEMIAKGDLAVAKATADADKLRAESLEQGKASQLYVAKELAPILSSLKGGIISETNPYDLDAWLKLLGVGAPQYRGPLE